MAGAPMKAGLESVCGCSGASLWTATTCRSATSSSISFAGRLRAMPPYAVLRRAPGSASGILAPSASRNRCSVSSMCRV